jgi:hypothetical protein
MYNYLVQAEKHQVYVFFVLWNAAVMPTDQLLGLIESPAKLQSYIDVVLTPMVKLFSNITSLGGYEVCCLACSIITRVSESVSQ